MLDCGDILDITNIGEWHAAAVESLRGISSDVTIDVSNLQKIDTTGIQVLTAIVKSVEASGNKVIWSELSHAFQNAATNLGVDTILGITQNQAKH